MTPSHCCLVGWFTILFTTLMRIFHGGRMWRFLGDSMWIEWGLNGGVTNDDLFSGFKHVACSTLAISSYFHIFHGGGSTTSQIGVADLGWISHEFHVFQVETWVILGELRVDARAWEEHDASSRARSMLQWCFTAGYRWMLWNHVKPCAMWNHVKPCETMWNRSVFKSEYCFHLVLSVLSSFDENWFSYANQKPTCFLPLREFMFVGQPLRVPPRPPPLRWRRLSRRLLGWLQRWQVERAFTTLTATPATGAIKKRREQLVKNTQVF